MTRPIRRAAVILSVILFLSVPATAQVELPTPPDHYETFDAEAIGLGVFTTLSSQLDFGAQMMVQQFMSPREEGESPNVPRENVLAVLNSLDLDAAYGDILELIIHQSSVLDVVPENASQWIPVVHDSLLFFLDGLGRDRMFERILNLIYLPGGSGRGDRLLEFTDRTASLQKIGQILARNPDLPADLRQSLQSLENGMATSDRDEMVEFITTEVGHDSVEAYQVEFADEILAEASVGAVIRASLTPPDEAESRDVVFKIVKPYVLDSLPRELAIVDELALFFQQHRDDYNLGNIPLSDMFRDVRTALSSEIRIEDEQRNLVLAEAYYGDNPRVHVPHLYPFSTPNVTVMEFINGGKITDAHPGRAEARAEMARRLSDALTVDVVFSRAEEAIFHGDPHAGNVFHISADPSDPYRIALLDWGLYGSFPRTQREQLVQLILGVYLGNAKRIRNNAGALLEEGLPEEPEDLEKVRRIVDDILEHRSETFPTLENLILELAREGFQTRFNIALFIKSQLTIAGILQELDPEFDHDAHFMGRTRGLAWREFPKHLLNVVWFPAWNSHNYRSMLSNEDIRDIWTKQLLGFFKGVGSGIGRAFAAVF